jgi:putative hydrolase of the HAD superfamily
VLGRFPEMTNTLFPKVIIFDLDDTIIRFGEGEIPAWKIVCARFCRKHCKVRREELFTAILKTGRWYWGDKDRHRTGRSDLRKARRQVAAAALQSLGIENGEYANEIADHYSDLRRKKLRLFPKARQTLMTLKKKNQRMVLLTNGESSLQRYKIERFKLGRYFEKVFIEGEVGFGKPDKRAYTNLLEDMHLVPADVWMVGDNLEWDIYTPKSLGIYSIWNDYRKKGLPGSCPFPPDRIIHNISELLLDTGNL